MVRKDDDDLKDLLGENTKTTTNRSTGNAPRYANGQMSLSVLDFCSQYTSMLCYFYPVYCGIFTVLVVFGFFLFFLTFIVNTTKEYGNIVNDHSNIQSSFDLKVGSIDHWCLGGGNDNCPCEDPLQPLARVERPSWVQAVKANRKKVRKLLDMDVDVAFVGESIIEEMGGRWMGQKRDSRSLDKLEHMFENNFSTEHGGPLEGVALGIAGDTAPNVLWRLLHGEMEDGFDPAIWWVSLGNNDLGRMMCSEEVVEMGILRVVEEILDKKPKAHVVINSIFPMTDMRGGLYPVLSDYRDSFTTYGQQQRASPFQSKKEGGDLRRSLVWGDASVASTTATVTAQNLVDDEELKEKARVEEEARDKKARVEKYYQKNFKEDPVMRDAATVRKYKPGTFRAARKPIWTSIKAINKALEKFANNHPRVTFFDCTPMFVKSDSQRDRSILLTKFISMRGHPTEAGFRLWEEQIKTKATLLMEEYHLGAPENMERSDDDGFSDDEVKPNYDDIVGSFGSYGDGASITGPEMRFNRNRSIPNEREPNQFGPVSPAPEKYNSYAAAPPQTNLVEESTFEKNTFPGSGTAPFSGSQQAPGSASTGGQQATGFATSPTSFAPPVVSNSAALTPNAQRTSFTGADNTRTASFPQPLGYAALTPNIQTGNSFGGADNTRIETPLQPAVTEASLSGGVSSGVQGGSSLRGNWTSGAPAYNNAGENLTASTGGATSSKEESSESNDSDDENNGDDVV